MSPHRDPQTLAAESLSAVAPLAARWMERLLAQNDPALTVTQYLALRAIAYDNATGRELALRAGISGPAVSQLLAGLSDSGLLDRHVDQDDRRRQVLTLSPAGRAAFASAEALLAERLGALLTGVPRPELDAIARLLPQIESALAGKPPPRRPARPPPPRHHR
jgi:DNA-binding MarR family transcriptional regulator